MKKRSVKIKIGETKHRYRVILEDEDSEQYTESYNYRQKLFLKTLADSPDLLLCGYLPFERLKIYYDGQKWIAEAEAEGD